MKHNSASLTSFKDFYQSYFGKTDSSKHIGKLHPEDDLHELWSQTPLE